MRHEHLVVTVEADVKERVEDDLGPGESLEAWVADAVERKLAERRRDGDAGADDGTGRGDADAPGRKSRRDRREGAVEGRYGDGSGAGPFGDADDERRGDDSDDGYDEGFEFVDDCSI